MENQHNPTPPSTEVSPVEPMIDAQANDGNVPLAIGQRLSGRYRIEREIGEGGMGVVYLVADEQVAGESFAIKVLKITSNPESLELLRGEVTKTRNLSHPNIVDVHSVNVDGTRLYVLMEYLQGKSLNALLDEDFGRGMPFSRARPIIEDACAALSYAHDHSVIHSDLKPANIFVANSGKTKLLDFGIARFSRGPLMRTRSGPLVLTAAYASCEMLAGEEADRRDDIYSLAFVIYEMLCGERPFGKLNALEARAAKLSVPPLAALTVRQNNALAQALVFDRKARTASVEQLLDGLLTDRARSGRTVGVGAAVIAAIAVSGLGYFILDKLWMTRHSVSVQAAGINDQQTVINPKSIAVLPFFDLSEGHRQQYFADGLTTALIDRLMLFPGLSVTGQTSSFALKDTKEDGPTIGQRLRVGYLLEGTVRGSSDQLRVSTRLIRAADGFELWSQTFDRSGIEILTLEDDIARAVAMDLRVSLDIPAPAVPSTRSLEAYRLLLQSTNIWRHAVGTDDERALIEAALQKDPGYVHAWIDLGSWWYDSMLLGKIAPEVAAREARAAYDKALALDNNYSRTYVFLAWLQMSQLDWAEAKRSIARAESLDPASLSVLTARGELARSAGQWAEAINLERARLERDPLNPDTNFVLAQSHFCAGDFLSAEKMLRPLVSENPEYPGAHVLLARILAVRGDSAAALKVAALESDEPARLSELAVVEYDLGHREAADASMAALQTRFGETLPGLAGIAYAYRNELEPAFQWLPRAAEKRQPEFAASLACTPEPAFAPLHADPRFAALRSRLGPN